LGEAKAFARIISGNQKSPLNLRETENQAEEADAAVSHYTHPIEGLFAKSAARHPIGREIPKNSPLLGIADD